ncbi:Homeodomain [Rhizoctonia solani]|uniref:Homeodomain n=1 Tax=Rhizoctonia solani TaxID=456999 RepID=A0A8H7LZ25_9AGAM|nr:Homeodomain [Rhizoctonia solani]
MAWNFELMDSQQSLVDEPRRSRRTASAQLVVSTDHTHSTDITIEVPDETPKPPTPTPMPAVAPGDLESPLSPPSASSTPSQSATFSNVGRTRSATLASPCALPSTQTMTKSRAALVLSASAVLHSRLPLPPPLPRHDRSPTAARRKEISEQLGMQERQTQIWFQNRRAKAKLVESKGRSGRPGSPGSGRDTPPDTPPELSPGYEADLQALLHETDPISIIPCTDLTIGSWHRIADRTGRHDLVAYISDVRASLTWFIHSGGHGFKMEIPISTVVNTEFTQSAPTHPGHGIASFYVSEKPIFYMEDAANGGAWQICDDWTEGRQASHVMKHQLVGSSIQLGHAMRNFEARRQGLGRPMQIPQPPMLSVPTASHAHQQPHLFTFPPNRQFTATHGRKRSYSGPPAPMQMGDVFGPDYAEDGAGAASHGPATGTLSSHGTGHGHAHQGSMSDFSSIPISQLSQRPFSADPSRQFPQDPARQFTQDPARQFSQDPSRPFNQDPSRPFSADSNRTFTQDMSRFDPSRPYMDRRATFDVAAHGTGTLTSSSSGGTLKQTAQGEGYAGYGDVYAEGMFTGMAGQAIPAQTMAPNPTWLPTRPWLPTQRWPGKLKWETRPCLEWA